MELPPQNPPIERDLLNSAARLGESGVEAAQTACDNLTGMARQMCYAIEYGVST